MKQCIKCNKVTWCKYYVRKNQILKVVWCSLILITDDWKKLLVFKNRNIDMCPKVAYWFVFSAGLECKNWRTKNGNVKTFFLTKIL